MPLQNKNRLAYLGALSLLFSYAEMLLPRFVPFFRLGLGNIAILLALELDFPSFLILCVIKSVASSMMGGTLISPFFVISITQSVISGLVMFGFFRIKGNWLSVYGISMIGSAVSAVVQLLLSSLYLGFQTMTLLGPMLLFSIAAAVITAFLSVKLNIPQEAPALQRNENVKHHDRKMIIFAVAGLLAVAVVVFVLKNQIILAALFVLALALQLICGRKIYILPYVSMWIFILLVSLFTHEGKVLFYIGKFSVTLGALQAGTEKALKLSIVCALSQCAASLRPASNTLLALSLSYFGALLNTFRTKEGKFLSRLQQTLSASELEE